MCAEGKSKDFDVTKTSKAAGAAGLKRGRRVGKEAREVGRDRAHRILKLPDCR